MTLREKLELAGYRLRALAGHMPTDWQKNVAMGWADEAVRAALTNAPRAASGIETEGRDHEDGHGAKHESPAPQGDARK